MELALNEQERAFREEVRQFLAEELTEDIIRATVDSPSVFVEKDIAVEWHRRLQKKNWYAQTWPEEYGGAGWSAMQQFIYDTEAAAAGAPTIIPMGVRMVGPVIIEFGSEEQKDYFLPRLLSGEHYWCQGYSEPGAGSDLASVKTRAESDGDDYVVNGTKIWTTHAHYANWIFCLVRTSSEGKPQKGISFLLIDMDSPGVSVRPIRSLSGDHEINQVFFDDVRVPKGNRIGAEGAGWTCAKYLLEHERGGVGSTRLKAALAQLKRIAAAEAGNDGRPLSESPLMRSRIAEAEIDIIAQEYTELRLLSRLATGQPAGAASSVLKTMHSETQQRLTELALEAVGNYGVFLEPRRPLYEIEPSGVGPGYLPRIAPEYLNTRAASIYAGTNEIQRSIIARSLLGL